MDAPLTSPGYTCLSNRSKTVQAKYRNKSRGPPVRHIAIDSTRLKVFGESEWKTRKDENEKRRTWRKLHLSVDVDTHEVISAEVSLANVGDSEVLPTLPNLLRRQVDAVSGDGAYNTKECHKVLKRKGIKPLKQSHKNSGVCVDRHLRNVTLMHYRMTL
ncbi:hypothetical protein VIN01S_22070 [Vibrio inusitatus NBRC 102082]|uniref:Transposase IS4-like domain-containing protein n=1 Tax=Vibrio inusitatus NBRC 102082 TaxID=1219070 RepID=A0A4Y3HW47_9VIBR|nr:hypothetical protein VIN01S_22070 [Vibrio inusitatus NBRC 102082]